MENIWIWIETQDGSLTRASLELFTAAKMITDHITVVMTESNTMNWQTLGEYGVKQVIVLRGISDAHDADCITDIFSQAIETYKPSLVLAAASDYNKNLMPRFSARADGYYIANITRIAPHDNQLMCTYPAYGGNILVDTIIAEGRPCFITLRAGSFTPATPLPSEGVIKEDFNACINPNKVLTTVKEVVQEITESVDLESAEIIVTGGRGMGSADGFRLVQKLADILHGAVGATRPAIEEGWISKAHQVGQSGKVVAPKLYIACGVSGTTQHVSAIMDSKLIVAINKDEDAPIFSIADIGIVGDALEILPMMIEEILRTRNA